jgi:hypothetical protein
MPCSTVDAACSCSLAIASWHGVRCDPCSMAPSENDNFHCSAFCFRADLRATDLGRGSRRKRSTPLLREASGAILTTVNSDFD